MTLTLSEVNKFTQLDCSKAFVDNICLKRLEQPKGSRMVLSDFFNSIEHCSSLEEIDIAGYFPSTEVLSKLLSLCKAKHVSILKLGRWSFIAQEDLECIAHCPGLRTVMLRHGDSIQSGRDKVQRAFENSPIKTKFYLDDKHS